MDRKLVMCGGFRCGRLFEPSGNNSPSVYICGECEKKINVGIKHFLHSNTGNPHGNLNISEKNNGIISVH